MTFRSFVVCLFALLLMGMWNEYHTCFLGAGGDALLENSPPNGAVTTLVIVLFIAALLYRFRRSFGLVTAELVVIYAALLIAAPLMTQGLWHRLFGLIAALPHNQDFKSYESLPSMLWPHGENLVINGRFVQGLVGLEGFTVTGTKGDYKQDRVKLAVNTQFVPALVKIETTLSGKEKVLAVSDLGDNQGDEDLKAITSELKAGASNKDDEKRYNDLAKAFSDSGALKTIADDLKTAGGKTDIKHYYSLNAKGALISSPSELKAAAGGKQQKVTQYYSIDYRVNENALTIITKDDTVQRIKWKGAAWTLPRLVNAEKDTVRSQLEYTIPRYRDAGGKRTEILTPGESYLFSCLVNATGFKSGSYYFVRMSVDGGSMRTVLLDASMTAKTFANPTGLKRIGKCPVIIPTELQDHLTLAIGLMGPGQLTIHDVEFFNSKGVETAFTGVYIARKRNLQQKIIGPDGKEEDNPNYLPPNERNNMVIKPDSMLSLAGLGYLLQGFIPLQQWIIPMFAWSLLIGALFMGFFGLNVMLRKQWVESERFTYPMNLFPRQFFGDDAVDLGDMLRKLFSNRVLWFGFAVMMPLVLLKGIHFYVPSVPAPSWGDMWLSKTLGGYVTQPLLKAFLNQAGVNLVFSLFSIALLIETDLLLSIWVFFFLFQLWYVFGQAFNFTRYEGYPWQWSQVIGAFIGYALLALVTARRHLANVFKQIFGLKPRADHTEVVSYRTAFIMVIASLITIGVWGVWTKMGLKAALLFFGWILICGLTSSKLRAEAGLPFGYWSPYFGMMFVGALGGFVTFGTTGMLVAAIVSGFIGVSCFYFVAPAQVEMMELGRHFKVRPRDVGWGLTLGLLGGLIIGGFTFMSWAYGKGADNFSYSWPYIQGTWYFSLAQNYVPGEVAADSAFATNKLANPKTAPLDFANNINAKGMGIGFVLTLFFAFLRQTFMWFPLHPLGYVLAGSHFGYVFWFTCFLAWAVRFITLRIGGAHTIRKGLVPFSIGMFLACMASIIIFEIVGFYFQAHGMTTVYCSWP